METGRGITLTDVLEMDVGDLHEWLEDALDFRRTLNRERARRGGG